MQLYLRRTFGEKITDIFAWVRQYWRPLLKFTTIFLLPVSLVQPLGLVSFVGKLAAIDSMGLDDGNPVAMLGLSTILLFALTMVMSFVGMMLSMSLCFTMHRLTIVENRDLNAFTVADMWRAMRPGLGKSLALTALYTAFFLLWLGVIGLAALAGIGGLGLGLLVTLSMLLFLALLPAVALIAPHYFFSTDSLWHSVSRGFRYGLSTWWGVVSLCFVVMLVANVLQSFASLPFQVTLGLNIAMLGELPATGSTALAFITFLSGVVMCYVQFLTQSLSYLALTVQYGHAVDKVDGVSVADEIDSF